MAKMICPRCMDVFLKEADSRCSGCGGDFCDFTNDDDFLRTEALRVAEERNAAGLGGLVRGLDCVIINTEPHTQKAAVQELLACTGLKFEKAFEDSEAVTCVLGAAGTADFLVRSRKTPTPFEDVRAFPKASGLPNTRLETFVFDVIDLERYVAIQQQRGIRFLSDEIIRADGYCFIQTIPSSFSGISIGFIQWISPPKDYASTESKPLDWSFRKPDSPFLANIKELDHAATRVEAKDRDPAIIEFMNLTSYNFDFSIYVKTFNSITNVARLSKSDFAMVFTSGIHPYVDEGTSGPTEKFVHNYGKRVHHIAFNTEKIESTVDSLKSSGMQFLLELVGSEEEGLKQIFSTPSRNTLLVNEYIHRYGDFDGFFTKGNVSLLTAATDKQ
ncbi:MAG: hypothetical protein JSU70_09510 [Phycisphaerales bacterium]|nr:MAG: hypothetical protein JSU70_09510 [Phycisphaerales bacterium]